MSVPKAVVCILPMRDWNKIFLGQGGMIIYSLYLTYEGLKPQKWEAGTGTAAQFVSYLWGIETLLFETVSSNIHWFVSYLWGIETLQKNLENFRRQGLYLTYEGLKQIFQFLNFFFDFSFVSYLWGIETPLFASALIRNIATFVSYLWGIETSEKPILEPLPDPCLYLTYEGLKLSMLGLKIWWAWTVCILPMRDWNLCIGKYSLNGPFCLYLTYEGLKPMIPVKDDFEWVLVCILPMRDWNSVILSRSDKL